MSKAIWKYPIQFTDVQTVNLPEGAEILTADVQHGTLCIWAMVNPDAPKEVLRTIEVFGTGHPMPEGQRRYIGTTQMAGGSLIWHVFERE